LLVVRPDNALPASKIIDCRLGGSFARAVLGIFLVGWRFVLPAAVRIGPVSLIASL